MAYFLKAKLLGQLEFLFQLVWGLNWRYFFSFLVSYIIECVARFENDWATKPWGHSTSKIQMPWDTTVTLGAPALQAGRIWRMWQGGGDIPFPSSLLPVYTFRSLLVHEDTGPTLLPVRTSKHRTQWFLRLGFLQKCCHKEIRSRANPCMFSVGKNQAPVDSADFWLIACPSPPL